MTVSCRILLRMRIVSKKSCGENQNRPFACGTFFSENPTVFEIIRKTLVEQERPHMTMAARFAGLLRLLARKHTPSPVRAHLTLPVLFIPHFLQSYMLIFH